MTKQVERIELSLVVWKTTALAIEPYLQQETLN